MTARSAAIILVVATASAIVTTMAVRMILGRQMSVEIDNSIYTTQGVDISAHNGVVDFDSVAQSGIRFVYMKATEGATWRDSRFASNYAEAAAAGLNVGVYHFFRFDIEGWRQSVNLLRTIGSRRLDLPIAIDVEEWGNPSGYSTEQVVDNLRSMIELVRRVGREVIIYTNKDGYHRYVRGRFDDVDLWICSFTNPPLHEHERWTLWQYSHIGHVDGIKGAADLCTFNTPCKGGYESWLATMPSVARVEW